MVICQAVIGGVALLQAVTGLCNVIAERLVLKHREDHIAVAGPIRVAELSYTLETDMCNFLGTLWGAVYYH